ncbi:MAG: hypothetical protein IT362_07525 [Deltaproteobacteria bacterium]|nr:hypothetical protein [Deltaproteobacteria bacterium]
MHGYRWQLITGAALLTLSAFMYLVHYALFRDSHHIFSYLITDLAFLPVEVFLVTMVIHQLFSRMEAKARLEKLNMLIGVFFSEIGASLLARLSAGDPDAQKVRVELAGAHHKTDAEFRNICKRFSTREYATEMNREEPEELKVLLASGRGLFVQLMENPTLLEHESFTDLLMAVAHLSEELSHRVNIKELPEADLKHLNGDIKRVYCALAPEWFSYMKHLKSSYPFLFSLAIRTNPFDSNASAVVKE